MNNAALNFVITDENVDPISSAYPRVEAPFNFGSAAANKSIYYSMKRQRSKDAPGYSYVRAPVVHAPQEGEEQEAAEHQEENVVGDPIPGWNASINNNFTLTRHFAAR